jgi:hypothetical protein
MIADFRGDDSIGFRTHIADFEINDVRNPVNRSSPFVIRNMVDLKL